MRAVLCLFLGLSVSLLPQQQAFSAPGPKTEYPAAAIPENLKKGANAIIRNEATTFTVISTGKAVTTEEKVITVLNAQGLNSAMLVVHYNRLSKIKKLEGRLLGANGQLIRKLKSDEVGDYSATGSSLITDNRVKAAQLNHSTYPYTVIWTTEVETTNLMFYPGWQPPVSEKTAVENCSFEIVCPGGLPLRYKLYQLPAPEITSEANGAKRYRWSSKNLQATVGEPFAPYWKSSPFVLTAPATFEVEGYTGSLESWQEMGDFMNQLNKGKDKLPEEVIAQVKALTSKCTTPKEKIKVVYEYMQQHTRYVSIQLGIGGWQPFEATFVNQKGYGDCKALSNYTKALLKAAGIEAHYALIHAGSEGTDAVLEDFSKSYFNHAIIGVPLEKDTVWLECTSQTNPFNYLGSFTGNRKALMVTETGGKLVNTRYYSAADNLQQSSTTIDLQQEQPHYQLFRRYKGIQFDEPFGAKNTTPENQKKWLLQAAALPDLQLEEHSLVVQKALEPVMVLEVKGKLQSSYRSGNRLFLPLNPGKFVAELPTAMPDRKTDFVIAWGYTYSDTVTYLLPTGYKVEYLPEAQQLKSTFGEFTASTEQQPGKLVFSVSFCLKDGSYAAATYAAWVTFMQQAANAYNSKAVLVRE